MNARQKAKKYKQQLEDMKKYLPTVNTVYTDRTNLIHCKSCFATYGYEAEMCRRDNGTYDPKMLTHEIQCKLINDIIPALKESIKYDGDGIYALDIWVKK